MGWTPHLNSRTSQYDLRRSAANPGSRRGSRERMIMCKLNSGRDQGRRRSSPVSNSDPHFSSPSRPLLLEWLFFGIFCGLISFTYSALAKGTVTTCDQSALETALAGGGNVTFGCSGVILLTSTISITTDTVLDGTGQSVTISGNDSVRLFNVGNNVSFTLINLTLAHG